MVVAPSTLSLSPSTSIILHPKNHHNFFNAKFFQVHSLLSPLALPSPISRTNHQQHNKHSSIHPNPARIRRISAAPPANYSLLVSEAAEPAEVVTEQLVTTSDDGGISVIISALLFIAFVGLSILTIGVIYIGVTDFLQKREKEKFEKEEAAKEKKGGKKRKVKARAGPKGFGQKADEADLLDDV